MPPNSCSYTYASIKRAVALLLSIARALLRNAIDFSSSQKGTLTIAIARLIQNSMSLDSWVSCSAIK